MPALVLSCSVALAGEEAVERVDPRDRRGRRYPLVALVRAAACAVAAGARSYAAIGHWLRRAPQDALARLGFPVRGMLGVRPAASMDMVRRVMGRLHPDGLAVLLRPAGTEWERPVRLAADGKRGTLTALRTAGYTPVLEAETGTTVLERSPEERAESQMPPLAQAHYGPGPATASALAAALLCTSTATAKPAARKGQRFLKPGRTARPR
ncbi:transposase family protein [Streptomyces sp. NPDC048419]|uniref:transposase family protein n=1 Tax=Streptomyces sp. NPDC048419 TaxID=3365547 RepID=UPI0037126399